jgi:isoquinoline 1-oxidoreductase alpha subunit
MVIALKVNGQTHSVDVDGDTPLLWALRDVLGMTGTKLTSGIVLCGVCTLSTGRVSKFNVTVRGDTHERIHNSHELIR